MSSGQPSAAAAQDALAKAFQDFLAKKFAGQRLTCHQNLPVHVRRSILEHRVVLLTHRTLRTTIGACKSEVEGLTGVAQSNSTVDVEVPHLGRRNALVMDNSVNMACMGEACEDISFQFYWPAYASEPHFIFRTFLRLECGGPCVGCSYTLFFARSASSTGRHQHGRCRGGKTQETGTEGPGGRESEQGGPMVGEGGNGCRPQRSRHSTGPAASEGERTGRPRDSSGHQPQAQGQQVGTSASASTQRRCVP